MFYGLVQNLGLISYKDSDNLFPNILQMSQGLGQNLGLSPYKYYDKSFPNIMDSVDFTQNTQIEILDLRNKSVQK